MLEVDLESHHVSLDQGNETAFKIRCVSPWPKNIRLGRATIVSSDIPFNEADAILCYWAPSDELFEFQGPKLWYNCEPQWCFDQINGGEFARLAATLPNNVLINHRARDPEFRVPHVTHWGECTVIDSDLPRIPKGIAVVSNNGCGADWVHQDLKLRNEFATADNVDLYGRSASWQGFSRPFLRRARSPRNFKGEIKSDSGKWHGESKRSLQATYKVSVCLENACEENYFTEKFVEAVQAGCIPVYRADSLVASTFLQGAAWVDPSDYGFSVRKTMKAALAKDRIEIAEQNARWLETNKYLAQTQGERVFERLASILRTL